VKGGKHADGIHGFSSVAGDEAEHPDNVPDHKGDTGSLGRLVECKFDAGCSGQVLSA